MVVVVLVIVVVVVVVVVVVMVVLGVLGVTFSGDDCKRHTQGLRYESIVE